MSNGEDLLNALRKVGCPHLENIDADTLDWHFENSEFASFLKEFCSRVESGQLQAISGLPEECQLQTEVSSQTLLTPEFKENSCFVTKVEEMELRIQNKKDHIAHLKHKLDLIKKENAKADLHIASLREAEKRNNEKLSAMKMRTKETKKHLSGLLETLEKSHGKLLAALSDSAGASESAHNATLKGSRGVLQSSSSSSSLDSYLEKEKALFAQLEQLAEEKTQQKLDSEAELLLQEWRNEQLRLQKCFSMTVRSYNFLKALESTLLREIELLKQIVERKLPIQEALSDSQVTTNASNVYLPDSEIARRSNEACEELANKALSSLFLTNYKIKLERLQEDLNHQEKILGLFRKQQVRLSLLQLSNKLETERKCQLLSLCQKIGDVLKGTEATYNEGIETLRVMNASQQQTSSETVPIDDHVMKTLAEVLGSDPEELIPRFDSIAQAAVVIDQKVRDDKSTNEASLESVLDSLQDLKTLHDVLNGIQEPISDSTDYHGNMHLARAIRELKVKMNLYISSIADVQTSFEYFKKDLESSDREKFERNLKMRNVVQKIQQK